MLLHSVRRLLWTRRQVASSDLLYLEHFAVFGGTAAEVLPHVVIVLIVERRGSLEILNSRARLWFSKEADLWSLDLGLLSHLHLLLDVALHVSHASLEPCIDIRELLQSVLARLHQLSELVILLLLVHGSESRLRCTRVDNGLRLLLEQFNLLMLPHGPLLLSRSRLPRHSDRQVGAFEPASTGLVVTCLVVWHELEHTVSILERHL